MTGQNLESLERLGKIINGVGVPLVLALFVAVYFGWVPSPTTAGIDKNRVLLETLQRDLDTHERENRELTKETLVHMRDMSAATMRLIDLIKLIDCADIPDKALRDRCMSR